MSELVSIDLILSSEVKRMPELHLSFINNLPPSSFSFTTEHRAIIEVLTVIS